MTPKHHGMLEIHIAVLLFGLAGLFGKLLTLPALAHVLFIRSLVHVKAQLASMIACLEPLYGIIFALVLFGEVPALRTILGGGIILGTIILATIKRNSSRV